jgi:hypothetical protein
MTGNNFLHGFEGIRRLAIIVSCMIAMVVIVLIVLDVMEDCEVWKDALGHDRTEPAPYMHRKK